MTKEIRWGMIGCGDVAETKSGPAFALVDGASLRMVTSKNPGNAEEFARRHGIPRWTDDARELIESPDIDAVYIATPPDSHLDYTKRVAAAKKPVLSEKPMARYVDEAEAMVAACARAGVPLFVAYYRRALPRFLMIKEWLDAGRIGTPRFVHMQHTLRPESHPVAPITPEVVASGNIPWRYLPEVGGGGNFIDMATHMIDMVDYLLGPIAEVKGKAENKGGLYPGEDTVSAWFRLENGVHGTGQWCYVAGTNVDRMEIVGSDGAIRFSFFDQEPHEIETEKGIERIEARNPKYFHQPIIQTVTDELLGRGTCPSTAENGMRAMRVQAQILADMLPAFRARDALRKN